MLMVAALTVPIVAGLPSVDPLHDRMPFGRKIKLLADLGYWRALEREVNAHGWGSAPVNAFIDAHLPKACCGWRGCGCWFYAYSGRVKYCSDRCRREGAKGERSVRSALPPVPPLTSDFVRLVRDKGWYELRLLPELLGGATLVRRWWYQRNGQREDSLRYPEVASAEMAFRRYRDEALRRGYREEASP